VFDAHNLRAGGMPVRVVSAALGLHGPHLTLDAACSSALYALRFASDFLAAGRADLMVAAAVCAPDLLMTHLCFSALQAYPRNGLSLPFDARSGGVITGQGAGALVLKRLPDALRDSDRVYAVVESVGLSNDGAGRHALAPNVRGQVDAYQRAYAGTGIDPATIQYLECHATGTSVGDVAELAGIDQFFGARGRLPYLGSVKSNVGHLLTAAGMPSLVKVILAMRHGVIPPTIGVTEPLTGAQCVRNLVRDRMPWPDGNQGPDGSRRAGGDAPPRRAAVSAFGFGGANAHAVLTTAPGIADPAGVAAPQPPVADGGRLLPPRLDIIGMGCRAGPFDGIDDLERALFTGADGGKSGRGLA
jgi:acyl transferase domain-containing protein